MIKLVVDGIRCVSWSRGPFGPGVEVATPPPSPCRDYLFVQGQYIHDPLPPEEEPEDNTLTADELSDALAELAEMVAAQDDAIVELAELIQEVTGNG